MKCSFTGSFEDTMRIWRWEKTVHIAMNNDSVGYSVNATGDADVKDLNQIEGTPPKDTAQLVAVKAAPRSNAEVAAEQVKLIREGAAPFIIQLHAIDLKETKWSHKCREDGMKAPLVLAVTQTKTHVKKTLSLFSRST